MIDWNELQKQLSSGERKIEFITDDSPEYKEIKERALILRDAEAQYWFGVWQEKVNFSLAMAKYYYKEAQKGGVKEASDALNRINDSSDGSSEDKARTVTNQGRQDQLSSKKESNTMVTQNTSPIWSIQKHDFENAKKQIKKFSKEAAKNFDVRPVEEQGLVFAHKVTGEELNDRMLALKKHLQNINDTQIKLTKEFGQVYNALEALDKDYIQAILISVKATEKTSEGVKDAQEHIKKLVDDDKRTLEILKKFKQKLDSYAHLGDVDKIWSDCQKWHQEISKYSSDVSSITEQSKENTKAIAELESAEKDTEEKISGLSEQIIVMADGVEAAKAYTVTLEKIIHLQDIDEMWAEVSDTQDSIKSIGEDIDRLQTEMSAYREELDEVLGFKKELGELKHLMDIDDIWATVNDHSTQFDELKEHNDNLVESIRADKAELDERLAALSQNMTEAKELATENRKLVEKSEAFRTEVSVLSHLMDVDGMWNNVEEHEDKLEQCEKRDKELTDAIQKNKEEANENIAEATQTMNAAIEDLANKVRFAYWIAGASAGLAAIELVLLLMRVI